MNTTPLYRFVKASERLPEDYKVDELLVFQIPHKRSNGVEVMVPFTGTYNKIENVFIRESDGWEYSSADFDKIEWQERLPYPSTDAELNEEAKGLFPHYFNTDKKIKLTSNQVLLFDTLANGAREGYIKGIQTERQRTVKPTPESKGTQERGEKINEQMNIAVDAWDDGYYSKAVGLNRDEELNKYLASRFPPLSRPTLPQPKEVSTETSEANQSSFIDVLLENYEATKRMSEDHPAYSSKSVLIETYEDLIAIFESKYWFPVDHKEMQSAEAILRKHWHISFDDPMNQDAIKETVKAMEEYASSRSLKDEPKKIDLDCVPGTGEMMDGDY